MHTAAEVTAGGRSAVLRWDGEQMRAAIYCPEEATFEVTEAVPLPISPVREEEATVEDVRKLAIHREDPEKTAIEVRVGSDATPDDAPQPLAEWDASYKLSPSDG